MKKKIIALLMATVIGAALMTACGGKSTEGTSDKKTEATEQSKDESSDSQDYLSWTKDEWDAASEDEQKAAVAAYTVEIGKLMGQEISEEDAKAGIDASFESTKGMIDTYFTQLPDGTLQDVVDIAAQAMESTKDAQ